MTILEFPQRIGTQSTELTVSIRSNPQAHRLSALLARESRSTQVFGWGPCAVQCGRRRTVDIHAAVLATFGLTSEGYSLTQLRYDLRKMKAHGLVERKG